MFQRIVVAIPDWAIPHWWKVAYKIPPMLDDRLLEMAQIAPDSQFERVVTKWVSAVVKEGATPPADIAPAIWNLANDLMSGRDMVIRTGDYIAIQQHLRQG